MTFGSTTGPSQFSFTIKDDITGEPSSIECQDSSAMTFVALIEGALVLKDEAESKYYACFFFPNAIGGESPIPRA